MHLTLLRVGNVVKKAEGLDWEVSTETRRRSAHALQVALDDGQVEVVNRTSMALVPEVRRQVDEHAVRARLSGGRRRF